MNESVLFVVGAFIFAITIYGAVMAGGLMLTRVELDQEAELAGPSSDAEPPTRLPFNRRY